jgi:hypothetical protein
MPNTSSAPLPLFQAAWRCEPSAPSTNQHAPSMPAQLAVGRSQNPASSTAAVQALPSVPPSRRRCRRPALHRRLSCWVCSQKSGEPPGVVRCSRRTSNGGWKLGYQTKRYTATNVESCAGSRVLSPNCRSSTAHGYGRESRCRCPSAIHSLAMGSLGLGSTGAAGAQLATAHRMAHRNTRFVGFKRLRLPAMLVCVPSNAGLLLQSHQSIAQSR